MNYDMKNYYKYSFNIGDFYIIEQDNYIIGITSKEPSNSYTLRETNLIKRTSKELKEYLNGKRIHFDIPILLIGTEFQKKVWEQLLSVPYGEVTSYKYIAAKIGKPNASRAVGNACNKNPLLIIVPCHRILGSDKSLKGFAIGVDVKDKLLNLEAKVCMKN